MVARLVWECRGCIRDRVRRNAAKPCSTCVCWISPGCRKRYKIGFDHRNDHRQKKLYFYRLPWYHGRKVNIRVWRSWYRAAFGMRRSHVQVVSLGPKPPGARRTWGLFLVYCGAEFFYRLLPAFCSVAVL